MRENIFIFAPRHVTFAGKNRLKAFINSLPAMATLNKKQPCIKTIIVMVIISIIYASAHTQLANTKWKDTLKLDNPTVAEFDFAKDTLTVTAVADGALIETMAYTGEGGRVCDYKNKWPERLLRHHPRQIQICC